MFGNSIIRRAGALPREPTAAPPGSEEKIRVMTERASRREQLFHPLDGPGYRGGPVDSEDWPFDLADEAPGLLIPGEAADFDEDEEGIDAPEAPALCSWTEPEQAPELAGTPAADGDAHEMPAAPARLGGEPETTVLKPCGYEPDGADAAQDSLAAW